MLARVDQINLGYTRGDDSKLLSPSKVRLCESVPIMSLMVNAK
jgi:hypothetical protein